MLPASPTEDPRGAGSTDLPDPVATPFAMAVERADDRTVVRVKGELDLSTARMLEDCLVQLNGGGAGQVTIDLAETEFIDSSGMRALVVGFKQLRDHGGEMKVRAPTRPVLRALEIAGLDQVLPIDATARGGPTPPA